MKDDTAISIKTIFKPLSILLALTAIIAISGIVIFIMQENKRLILTTEFRMFRLAAELVQVYDKGEIADISATEGLIAFGIYSLEGVSQYLYGSAPTTIEPGMQSDQPVFMQGYVSFIRALGPPPPPVWRQRPMSRPIDTRLVYLSIRSTELQKGLLIVFIAGLFVIIALISLYIALIVVFRRSEQYRRRAYENRELVALGQAARTLAHEIKNPLGVMRIQTAILHKTKDENIKSSASVIEQEIGRLVSMTDRLRQFLSPGKAHIQTVELNEYLEALNDRYARIFAVEKKIQEPAFISVDVHRLDQILDNLIANAIDALESAGKQVSAQTLQVVLNKSTHDRYTITVIDSGCGISDEAMTRIGSLFYTTKARGSGLGLALVKKYLDECGGSLAWENKQEGGALFIIALTKKE